MTQLGSGRAVGGQWVVSGWAVGGQWPGSGWAVAGQWLGNGWAVAGTWCVMHKLLSCSVEAPSACSAGHLQQLIVQQGGVGGVAAAGEGGDDGGASRHVDPCCQSLRCKHHLQQLIP